MSIGEKIKAVRIKNGLTQKELGALLNVSPAMIGQYESGKRNPKIDTLQKIAEQLGVSTTELIDLPTLTLKQATDLSDKLINEKMHLIDIAQQGDIPSPYHKDRELIEIAINYLNDLNIDGKCDVLQFAEYLVEKHTHDNDSDMEFRAILELIPKKEQ